MTVNITIRNVPGKTRDALAARAARSGRSLQEYLSLQLEELAERPDPAEALTAIRERAQHYPRGEADSILRDLAEDRR
ncbi:MAG: hypothetical protein ABF811_02270 [Pseudoclavibacter sp.]|jgi:plasmid stability protein